MLFGNGCLLSLIEKIKRKKECPLEDKHDEVK